MGAGLAGSAALGWKKDAANHPNSKIGMRTEIYLIVDWRIVPIPLLVAKFIKKAPNSCEFEATL